jgi:hypothetical protein
MKTIGKQIKPGDIYAVHTGTYAGEMLIFIKKLGVDYCFLSIPNMLNRVIPKVIFEYGRNNNILKYVERVPGYVLKTSTAQYTKNEKITNRRQQPNTSNVLDGKSTITKNEN